MVESANLGSKENPAGSIADFMVCLASIERSSDRFIMFRGHADSSWELLPSIMRGPTRLFDSEKDISREIIAQYPSEFDQDKTTFDHLCRMQHYGIATRLLDVTSNPLTALFFAVQECPDLFLEPDGEVIYFDGPLTRRKYYDSDAVSCIANLSNVTTEEKDTLAGTTARTIAEFNELKPARRLLQFIRAEKPYFLPEIRREDLHTPYMVIPKLRSRRIIAQHGAFMIFGLDRKKGPSIKRNIAAKRIYVDGGSKAAIAEELAHLGFTQATLFPEIDRASAHLMARFKAA
jgi:hypothetical protein